MVTVSRLHEPGFVAHELDMAVGLYLPNQFPKAQLSHPIEQLQYIRQLGLMLAICLLSVAPNLNYAVLERLLP